MPHVSAFSLFSPCICHSLILGVCLAFSLPLDQNAHSLDYHLDPLSFSFYYGVPVVPVSLSIQILEKKSMR